MIIGLGQKGPVEAGLALEHTWGVPMIPGSALKGLTMAAAHLLLEDEAWRKPQGDQKEPGTSLATLAGTIKHIGEVIFHDAWWIPEGEKLPIHPDVMTVHHADYYPNGEVSPSDMDNPNPVPFASVTGKYLVVVEKTSPKVEDELLDAALYILKLGLDHLGIGAKTNAGYGRMTLELKAGLEVETLQQAVDRICAAAEGRRDAFMSEPFKSLLQAVPIHERATALLVMKPLFEDKKLKRKCQSEIEQLRRILEGEE
jgi:CRISPR type III-B/RAMP module RAMP protein Cmr6